MSEMTRRQAELKKGLKRLKQAGRKVVGTAKASTKRSFSSLRSVTKATKKRYRKVDEIK